MTKAAFAQTLAGAGAPFRDAERVAADLIDRMTARQRMSEQEWSIVYETIQRVHGQPLERWLTDLARRAGGTPEPAPAIGTGKDGPSPQPYRVNFDRLIVTSYGTGGSASDLGERVRHLAAGMDRAG